MGRASAVGTAASLLWVRVCEVDDLELDQGVSALVRGKQVALFRTADDRVHAVGNRDPFAGTPSMSRGIVGRSGGRPYVAAPAGHQRFDLATGGGLDQVEVALPVFAVRLVDGHVEVQVLLRARPT